MATMEFDIDLECEQCGAPLDATEKRGILSVDPCQKCLDASYEEGYDDGEHGKATDQWLAGYEKGKADGEGSV